MKLIPFIAESATEAAAQIRSELGPEAVVVNVRSMPATGVSRLWRKPRFEVLAYRPEAGEGAKHQAVANLISARAAQADSRPTPPDEVPLGITRYRAAADLNLETPAPVLQENEGTWNVGPLLERSGFLPASAQRVVDQLARHHGATPPPTMAEEIHLARGALGQLWRQPQPFVSDTLRPHVFIGPKGSGKTTCLCKWLTQTVLVEGRTATVWRLDGDTANTTEALNVYCDVLGVPVERSWSVNPESVSADIRFIDLPGVNWRNPTALRDLKERLRGFLSPYVHLVLNGAYDTSLLLAQARAFSGVNVDDVLVSHLDEEPRWGKLWNLVLGTNYSVRYLSAGQNIPGDFLSASAEKLFARQFPS